MVSEVETSQLATQRTAYPPGARALPNLRRVALALPWADGLILAWLYLFAAVLLTLRIGHHPANAYNWENYTAWGVFHFWDGLWPWSDLWRLTDGLMTDSGESPLVVLPIWLGWKLFGVGLVGLRVPLVLIGALAVPLTWLVGRRLIGPWAALFGAVLLAISPVFLLYGRTATLVGISLVPALLTIAALLRVLRPEETSPRAWIGWLAALQGLLIADCYAYSVIRFLWLIALLLFAVELVFRPRAWRWLGAALLVTALFLPAVLSYLGHRDGYPWDPKEAILRYYNGRGEQILRLNEAPEGYRFYLRQTEEEAAAGGPEGSPEELAWRLIRQNAVDYWKLLIDWETRPAITDYWNPAGRFYPRLLVPFFLLGLLVSAIHALRPAAGVETRALLALFFGFGIPLFLTSRVHIGRLIFATPFLFLLVAAGLATLAALLRHPPPLHANAPLPRRGAGVGGEGHLAGGEGRNVADGRTANASSTPLPWPALLAALILLALTAQHTWADYHLAPPPSRDWAIAQVLDAHQMAARAAGGAALVAADGVGAEIEAIDGGAYRLLTDETYRYVNLAELPPGTLPPAPPAGETRPTLYIGRILDRLRAPATMPGLCTTLYFVRPDAEAAFLAATNNGRPTSCPAPLEYILLPG